MTTLTPRVEISNLQAAQHLRGIYAVQNLQLGQTKAGKPYLKMLLADKTGRTPARMWSAATGVLNSDVILECELEQRLA